MNFIYRLNKNPAQPIQVTYAVLLLYAYFILSVLIYVVGTVVAIIGYSEQAPESYFVVDVVFNSLAYFLSFLIVRKISEGKNWARWFLLIAFCLVLLVSLIGSQTILTGNPIDAISAIGFLVVNIMAIALLFQRPSSIWFTTGEYYEGSELEPEESEGLPVSQPKTTDEKLEVSAPKYLKLWLVLSQLLSVLLLVPGFIVLIAAQGAEEAWVVLLVFPLLLHPVTAIICGVGAWILYAKAYYKLAKIVTSIPLFLFIMSILMLILADAFVGL